MNKKHQKTLCAIFQRPTRPDIAWDDIEKLILALGGRLVEREGSRVGIKLGDCMAVFHRPHPQRITGKGAIDAVRRFLIEAGVKPDA